MPCRKKTLAALVGNLSSVLHNDMVHIKVSSASECGRIIVITPKRLGSAPARNRMRRRFVELHRASTVKARYNIVIFVKKRLDTVPYTVLRGIFNELLMKL